jgi:subtilisin family serine protease
MKRTVLAAGLTAVAAFSLTLISYPRKATAENPQPDKPEPKAEYVSGRILVKFRAGIEAAHAQQMIAAHGARDAAEIPEIGVHIVELPEQASETAFVSAFAAQPEVEFAELDAKVAPAVNPNDPLFGSEWHLNKIAAPSAWSSNTGSSNVTIAILDTGCDPTHPDLAAKYVPGWNTYDNNSDTHDVYGHGTAVAGSAAAVSNNSTGVASVAWGCRIMPMRISDTSGYGYGSTIAAALTWAADHGARVANISYRMDFSSTVTSAAQYFMSRGGVVTMAAGNASVAETAGDNPYILVVSATDSADNLTTFTNYGNNLDLSAPGINIYTTNNGGGYGAWWGTSFSAPITAGVAGLVMSANPALTAEQVQDVMKQSADDLGAAGWDNRYGWGRLNASRAVSMATGGVTPPDTTPPGVAFSAPAAGGTVANTVTVQVNASDNVGVASVTLYLDDAAVANSPTAALSWSWNTLASVNGAHTLRAVATDTAGNTGSTQISVTVNNVIDTTPPTVAITSPAQGATVSRNVSVTVSAADNVGVSRVELYVDGRLTASSVTAPFSTSWNSRKAAAGAHTLVCKAYDAAGNIGVSQTVTVYK